MTFLAAVAREVGAPMTIESVRARDLGPEEVLVRMVAAGVCHTDFEALAGTFGAPMPTILGHEGAGVVEAVGAAVSGLRRGDPVVCDVLPGCASCFYCDRGLAMLCETPSPCGPALFAGAEPLRTFLNVSAFAQYAVVPSRGAVKMPRDMPLDRACLFGCAVATGWNAVHRIADVRPGESVAVIGCGAIGLNVLQGARAAGAEIIVAIDRDPGKLELARLFGATHVFASDAEGLVDAVRTLTRGRGVDHAVEAAGIHGSLQATLDVSRPGATVTILGKTAPGRKISLRFGSLMGERRLRRSSLSATRADVDYPAFAGAYLAGTLELDRLIDRRIPLSAINDAFADFGRGRVVRNVVTFDD